MYYQLNKLYYIIYNLKITHLSVLLKIHIHTVGVYFSVYIHTDSMYGVIV